MSFSTCTSKHDQSKHVALNNVHAYLVWAVRAASYKNAGRSAFRSQFLKGAHFKRGEHSPGAVIKTWSKARKAKDSPDLRKLACCETAPATDSK